MYGSTMRLMKTGKMAARWFGENSNVADGTCRCRFSIKAPMGKAEEFSEALKASARAVKSLLEVE